MSRRFAALVTVMDRSKTAMAKKSTNDRGPGQNVTEISCMLGNIPPLHVVTNDRPKKRLVSAWNGWRPGVKGKVADEQF